MRYPNEMWPNSGRGVGVGRHGRHVCWWSGTPWLAEAPHVTQMQCGDWPRPTNANGIVNRFGGDTYLQLKWLSILSTNIYLLEMWWKTRISKYCEIPEKRKEILLSLASDVVDRVHQSTWRTTHGNITPECRSNEFFVTVRKRLYTLEKCYYTYWRGDLLKAINTYWRTIEYYRKWNHFNAISSW